MKTTKSIAGLALIVMALFTLVVVRADPAAPAIPPGPIVSVPNVFSYQAPPGWILKHAPGATYPTAVDAPNGNEGGMIAVESTPSPGMLDDWFQRTLISYRAQYAGTTWRADDPKPFLTTAGVKGIRMPITMTVGNKNLYFVDYAFAGSGDTKITVGCTCLQADSNFYVPLFDAAMKTFVPQ